MLVVIQTQGNIIENTPLLAKSDQYYEIHPISVDQASVIPPSSPPYSPFL
jgi:hypothetical protein